MLSRKNYKERLRKMNPRKERFSIRKFSAGAASVLIGFTIFGMSNGQNAKADTVDTKTELNKENLKQNLSDHASSVSDTQSTENKKAEDTNKQATNPADKTVAAAQELQVSNSEASKADNASEANHNANVAAVSKVANQQAPKDNKAGNLTTENTPSANKTNAQTEQNLNNALTKLDAETDQGQSQTVTDFQGLINGLNDSSVSTINLDQDITITGAVNGVTQSGVGANKQYLWLDSKGSARNVVINGNGHKINFDKYSIALQNKNYENSQGSWEITLKDLNLEADNYGYAPISFYKKLVNVGSISDSDIKKSKLIFDGVNANLKGRTLTDEYAENLPVVFKGNNTINITDMANGTNAVNAYTVSVEDGTTNFNVDGDASGLFNQNNWMIWSTSQNADSTVIKKDATVNLNTNSNDMRGIFAGYQSTAGQSAYGTLVVDGTLNANMAAGHSVAIMTQNLEIGKTGNVTIHTKQDNNGITNWTNGVNNNNGTHYAPVTLYNAYPTTAGYPLPGNPQESHLLDNGKLTIIRDNTAKTIDPLISFGNGGINNNLTFKVVVGDGATLDLQDAAGTNSDGSEPNSPYAGLITMWGTGSTNLFEITRPEYVNLQRTGAVRGTMIAMQGVNNTVIVNGNTPIAQWDQGNKSNSPSNGWYLKYLKTQNEWGDNSGQFIKKGENPSGGVAHKGVNTLYNSNAIVLMGDNQGSDEYSDGHMPDKAEQALHLNSFLNNFNWWRPQRIAMGSQLNPVINDSDKYQPEVQAIDGTTTQTLNDLNPVSGIKDLIGPNGVVNPFTPEPVTSVTWYDSATDKTEWDKLMLQPSESKNPADWTPFPEPTNPTGNLKTTDKDAWAKVTYKDGTVDFINIPLNITQSSIADEVTPSYNPISVEQGKSTTENPSFTGKNGQTTQVPAGTSFNTDANTPNWATIDPSTGAITVNPSTNVTPGAYNVPVTVTYSDGSKDNTNVPVIVTKDGQTVIWGDKGAVVTTVDTSNVKAHETTQNSQVIDAAGVVSAEGYTLDENGKISTTATPITIDPSTVSWTTTPDTNVSEATAAGKSIDTSVKINFTNNDAAKNILGSKNGEVTTNPFTIDAKGAGAKNVTTPVNVALGSDLTKEQFGQLVDNNIPADEIASTAWETKPSKDNGGVIKITFKDNDADGQATYLNISIPASSINVTDDADKYTPTGQDVHTTPGTVPDASEGISNKGDLPKDTTYTWKDTPDVTNPGKTTGTVVVTYPDGSKDEVPTTIIVNAKPEIKPINTTVGEVPAASEGIANLNNGGTTPVDGYPSGATWTTAPDTSKSGLTTGTASVTYPDGTTVSVTIPVAVSNGQDINIVDDKGHSYSLHAANVVTHKTSDTNIIGEPVIESFTLSYYEGGQKYSKPYIYTLNADKTAYVLTQVGDNPKDVTVDAVQSVPVSQISAVWTPVGTEFGIPGVTGKGQPSSVASKDNNGTETITYTGQDHTQGSKYVYPMYSVTVDTSKVNWPIFGKGPSASHPFPFVYIYGAEANGTIPSVNSDTTDLRGDLGDAAKVVDTSALTKEHNSEVSSIVWKDLPSLDKADAKAPATVRINFTDGSHLDVPVSVNVIKVDHGTDDKTNRDVYRDITRTINIEGEANPVVQHVIYSRTKTTNLSKPVGQQVTYTDWVAENRVTEFPQVEVTKPGYDATATGATIETKDGKQYVPASATITPDSQNEVVNVTYHKQSDIPVPYKPGKDGVNDEMNHYVTRTIVVNNPDGTKTTRMQTVHFTNEDKNGNSGYKDPVTGDVTYNTVWHVAGNLNATTGTWDAFTPDAVTGYTANPATINAETVNVNTPDQTVVVDYHKDGDKPVKWDGTNDNMYREVTRTIVSHIPNSDPQTELQTVKFTREDAEGNAGYQDPVTGDIKWNAWHVVDSAETTGTWAEYNAPEVKGYTADPAKVAQTVVNADTESTTVEINYVPSSTDADKYTPEGQEVHTKPGVVPPAEDGIKNKDEMPSGTTYTWEKDPDVSKPGKTTGVIIVTYPDGSKDKVEVPVVIDKNPTDADKYTPEGQEVHTKPGVVPPAEDGIKNKDEMPSGTTYTWEKDPDVSKPGKTTGVIIVTYPDGSKDKVEVPVVIDKNPTDADKYTPEGQEVHTKPGVVPPAEDGIKNKDEMPSGTTYTWEKDPDVSKPGKTTGVIIVTYPDGSKDKVEVPVVIDVDHVTPEPQPIHTTPGVVPNPADGIKNKDEMPSGTTYTWKELPNVDSIGEHTGIVTVTYPDGSSVDVEVKVYVDGESKENNSKPTENNSEVNTAKAATVNENKHATKAALPQTGAKSENTAGIIGLAIAAVGGLLGLGADRKKRQK